MPNAVTTPSKGRLDKVMNHLSFILCACDKVFCGNIRGSQSGSACRMPVDTLSADNKTY
jgi:hypothetical protein